MMAESNAMSDPSASRPAFYRGLLLACCLAYTASIATPVASAAPLSSFDRMLLQAAKAGNILTVQEALASGANIKAQDNTGKTVLHWSASEGHESIVALLLEQGADINIQNKSGETAFYGAARNGHAGVVTLLLEKGAAIDARNQDGLTALHMAAFKGSASIASPLLEKGARIGAVRASGQSFRQLFGR